MKRFLRFALFGVAGLSLLCAAPQSARADIVLTSRTSNYDITFSNNAFANTNVNYSILDNFTGNNGDSVNYTLTTKSLAQNIAVTSSGGVTLSNVNIGVPSTTYTVDMGSSGTGSVSSSYSVGAGTSSTSWVTQGVSNGLNTLTYQGDGSENNFDGFPFTVSFALAGNWTTQGTSSGDIELFNSQLNPGWSQTQLSYNSGTNTTTLVYSTSSTQSTGDNGNIEFILYGSPVTTTPEPASMVMAASGALMALGYGWRRRKAAH
jgi:hypothetical protein